jgi:lipoyl(octanoyl) transferase
MENTGLAKNTHGLGVLTALPEEADEKGVSGALRAAHAASPAAPPMVRPALLPTVRNLGHTDYETTFAAMRDFTARRTAHTPDEIWLTQHNPVFTLGLASRREHVLRDIGIPLVQADRGGQVTYHGPGQVVAYLLIDLRRRGLKVRETVQLVEQAVIAVLRELGVHSFTRAGMPGVYVRCDQANVRDGAGSDDLSDDNAGDKIAALGLKVKNGCTYHGMSLNVNIDLSPYAAIDACGYPGLRSTSLRELGIAETPDAVATRLGHTLAHTFAGISQEHSHDHR